MSGPFLSSSPLHEGLLEVPLVDSHATHNSACFPLHDAGTRIFREIRKFVPCDFALASLPVSLYKDTRN